MIEIDEYELHIVDFEAVVCYKEGIQLFLEVVQQIQDKNKKVKYRDKAEQYLQELLIKYFFCYRLFYEAKWR